MMIGVGLDFIEVFVGEQNGQFAILDRLARVLIGPWLHDGIG